LLFKAMETADLDTFAFFAISEIFICLVYNPFQRLQATKKNTAYANLIMYAL